jgi:hypothetical protein
MSEELSEYGNQYVAEWNGKPFITKQMPKIDPYVISITVGECKCCQKTTYFVVDKNNAGTWGTGSTAAEAIADAKRLYADKERIGVLDRIIDEYTASAFASIEAQKQMQRIRNLPVQPEFKPHRKLEKKIPKRALVFQKNDGKCFYCDDQLVIDGEWHIEHKYPKSKGGSNDIENLVPACPSCNLRKKDKTAKEFLETST